MIVQLIINCFIKLSGYRVNLIDCWLLLAVLSAVATSSAAVSPEKFLSAASGIHSPQVEISFSSLPSEPELLDKRIRTLKKTGFGSIFLTSIPLGSNSWDHIAGVAESCCKHSIKLGCDFFSQVDNPALLYRIVWTNRLINAEQQGGKREVSVAGLKDKREITRFLIPLSYSNDIKRAYNAGRDSASLKEECVEYSFKAVPIKSHKINYLDKSVFENYVNNFLLNAQLRLGNNYGTVFDLVRFPSLNEDELVWTDNMPKWFHENISFELIHYLPVLVLKKHIDDPFIKGTRERYQRGLKQLWVENFAANVPSLVHEAGLSAAISVNKIPLPPEEYAQYFQFPLASGSTCTVQRALNCRAAGGARIHECSRQIGRVGKDMSCPGSIIDALFADGVTTLLFTDNIAGFSGSPRFDSLDSLCRYVNRCSYVLLNSEPTQGILLCSERIPQIMNHIIFDSVTTRMLKEAEIEKGRITFPSGRGSSTVAVSGDAYKSSKALFSKLRSSGVKVILLEDCAKLIPDFDWKSDVKNFDFRFVRRSGLTHEYFMIRNESDAGGMVDLTFKVDNFTAVSRWQPQDGKIYEIKKYRKSSPAQSTLSLPVRPNELFFVVFKHE